MKKAPQTRVAGVGTALGAVIVGSVMWFGGCQPGQLPCDKDDWKAICTTTSNPSSGSSTGGNSGNSGGSSGSNSGGSAGGSNSGGSNGGNADAMPPATGGKPNADTKVEGCGDYKTLGQMDTFFEKKCGSGTACHQANSVFGEFKGNKMWERGQTTKTKFDCMGTLLIDPSDATKGAFFLKINGDAKCGGAPLKMPPPNATPDQQLSGDEKTCLENYLKAIAGK
jgi:hypothetical protein